VGSMLTRGFIQPGAWTSRGTATARGFAVFLCESDFRDAMVFRSALCRTDYRAYLVDVWRRMALARRAGMRVLIGPFLIDQHVSFADRLGLAPFGTLALRRFDDFVAETCPQTRVWRGEPLGPFMSNLHGVVQAAAAPGRAPPRR
jgi:hypothetical protein